MPYKAGYSTRNDGIHFTEEMFQREIQGFGLQFRVAFLFLRHNNTFPLDFSLKSVIDTNPQLKFYVQNNLSHLWVMAFSRI